MGNVLFVVIDIAYWLLVIVLLARVILSWVNIGSYELRGLIFRITDPILNPVRRIMPNTGGVDFSPIIVLVAAQLLKMILQRFVSSF